MLNDRLQTSGLSACVSFCGVRACVCILFTLCRAIAVLNAFKFFIFLLIFMRYRRVISHIQAQQKKGKAKEKIKTKPKAKRQAKIDELNCC